MKVNVYTTPTCGFCKKTKDLLNELNQPFTEFDVTEDREKAQEMIKKTGQMGVPVTEVGEKFVIGYDAKAIKGLLKDVK